MLSFLLAWLVRLWLATLRVRVHGTIPAGPVVWVFWHGTQMALLARPRRPTAVLVSLSKDGQLQEGVMRRHGMIVVRGSSSRRASAGLRGLLRELEKGRDVAFAVDGPRGPLHRAKPGAAICARRSGAMLLPLGVAASHSITLGSWDRFLIPLPFSRVAIVIGEPGDDVEAGIHAASATASTKLRSRRSRSGRPSEAPRPEPWRAPETLP